MNNTVEGYLAQLKSELAGADPALVQDALYDAEDNLRTALADAGDATRPEAIAAAIDAYGTPAEVADAYRAAELTVAAALRNPPLELPTSGFRASSLGRFFGIIMDSAAWGAFLYMFLAFATGILYFTIVVTGVSLTLGLLVLILGAPIALLFLGMIRAISLAEGRIVEGLLGVRMPRRPYNVGAQGNLWERIKSWLTDYRTWTTMLYMVLQLPLGIIYFTAMVAALSLSAGAIAVPFAPPLTNGITGLQFGYHFGPWATPLFVIAGVLGLFATLWLAKGLGKVHGMWAKTMLVGRLEGTAAQDAQRVA